mmetsp:Transcript_88403/g.250551  ORF Transcript_88403/g.250551 Transcript_88403/m.250551 type:complete len:220 (-) Transcript_88403:91-750(-)
MPTGECNGPARPIVADLAQAVKHGGDSVGWEAQPPLQRSRQAPPPLLVTRADRLAEVRAVYRQRQVVRVAGGALHVARDSATEPRVRPHKVGRLCEGVYPVPAARWRLRRLRRWLLRPLLELRWDDAQSAELRHLVHGALPEPAQQHCLLGARDRGLVPGRDHGLARQRRLELLRRDLPLHAVNRAPWINRSPWIPEAPHAGVAAAPAAHPRCARGTVR